MTLSLAIPNLTTGRLMPQNASQAAFPFGLGGRGVHELVEAGFGDMAAVTGFMLAACRTHGPLADGKRGAVLWISQHRNRQMHGRLLEGAARINRPSLFIHVRKASEALWAVEEAIAASGVGLVVAEVEAADFTATRRLKLASLRHGAPVVLLMPYQREGTSACETRWRIAAAPSALNRLDARAPGAVRWTASLEKCRAAPDRIGEKFTLEQDHETLSLHLVSPLAARSAASPQTGATGRAGLVGEAFRRTG